MASVAPELYPDGIRRAYAGELVGERLYRMLSIRCSDPQQKSKFAAISRVERRTHVALHPIAVRLGVEASDDDINTRVAHRAAGMLALGWGDFIRKAVVDWPPYVQRFAALRELAPACDAEAVAILVRHEEALVRFAHSERDGNPSDESLRFLEAFLAESSKQRSFLALRHFE